MEREEIADQGDYISELIKKDMRYILLEIFLSLDKNSLHSARQTCQPWNVFISKTIYLLLRKRVDRVWREGIPTYENIQFPFAHCIYHVKSFQNTIIVGLRNGLALVYHTEDKEVRRILNHGTGDVQTDCNNNMIVTVCERGVIKTWRQDTGRLRYHNLFHLGNHINCVRIVNNKVVICTRDGTVTINRIRRTKHLSQAMINKVTRPQHVIKGDETIFWVEPYKNYSMITAGRNGVKIWDINEGTVIKSITINLASPCAASDFPGWINIGITLRFPYLVIRTIPQPYVIPSEEGVEQQTTHGTEIWDIEVGKLVAKLDYNEKSEEYQRHIVTNGKQLIIAEQHYEHIRPTVKIFIWSWEEIKSTIEDQEDNDVLTNEVVMFTPMRELTIPKCAMLNLYMGTTLLAIHEYGSIIQTHQNINWIKIVNIDHKTVRRSWEETFLDEVEYDVFSQSHRWWTESIVINAPPTEQPGQEDWVSVAPARL